MKSAFHSSKCPKNTSKYTLGVKLGYRRTEVNGVRKPEYNNIDIMLEENPASVPQFWFALGDIRYGN
ncbi:hypothetical protein, partial [Porphyromonas levii]|uniref:hypothetical protein n=1 Tax=Porphyromonas levii TaxID=28114 RepID=UPI001980C2F2